MAVLIRDDPEWPMPTPHQPTPRRLRVWRLDDGCVAAVITERGPGMSVTNVAESAHAALVADYPRDRLLVFEHYPADGTEDPEHFDQITVSEGQPKWRRWTIEEMIALAGRRVLDDSHRYHRSPCSAKRERHIASRRRVALA